MVPAINGPQVQHLEISKSVVHSQWGSIGLVRMPVNKSDMPQANEIRRPSLELGQHNKEVLKEFGSTEEEIERFKETWVI